MKLDVLDQLRILKICVAYKYRGKLFYQFPNDLEVMQKATPVYKNFSGWRLNTNKIRRYDDLPSAAKNYISAIEELCRARVNIISVGSGRDETLFR